MLAHQARPYYVRHQLIEISAVRHVFRFCVAVSLSSLSRSAFRFKSSLAAMPLCFTVCGYVHGCCRPQLQLILFSHMLLREVAFDRLACSSSCCLLREAASITLRSRAVCHAAASRRHHTQHPPGTPHAGELRFLVPGSFCSCGVLARCITRWRSPVPPAAWRFDCMRARLVHVCRR